MILWLISSEIPNLIHQFCKIENNKTGTSRIVNGIIVYFDEISHPMIYGGKEYFL